MDVSIDKIMDGITNELYDAINSMSDEGGIEEKLAYSEIVKNLSESLGVFLRLLDVHFDPDADYDYLDDMDGFED